MWSTANAGRADRAQEAYLRNAILEEPLLIFDMADAAKADLAKEAEAYMKEIGLTDAEIAKLRENLSKSTALPDQDRRSRRPRSTSTATFA